MRDVKEVNGIEILVKEMPNVDVKALRAAVDQFKQKLQTAVILLATVQDNKAQLIAGVTANCVDKINANDIIRYVVPRPDGSGDGRADMT